MEKTISRNDFSYQEYNNSKSYNETASLNEIKAIISPLIKSWLASSKSQFYIPTDGLSGSGKSTVANILEDIRGENGNLFEIIKIGMDMFVTTERESKERELFHKTEDSFWQSVYSRDSAKRILNSIDELDYDSGTFAIENAYRHTTGKMSKNEIVVPSGKKVIIADGIDAINLLDEASIKRDRFNLFVFTPAEMSLLSACSRDHEKKGVDISKRLNFRIEEYVHLIRRLIKTKLRPDVLVFNNINGHREMDDQINRFNMLQQQQNAIWLQL